MPSSHPAHGRPFFSLTLSLSLPFYFRAAPIEDCFYSIYKANKKEKQLLTIPREEGNRATDRVRRRGKKLLRRGDAPLSSSLRNAAGHTTLHTHIRTPSDGPMIFARAVTDFCHTHAQLTRNPSPKPAHTTQLTLPSALAGLLHERCGIMMVVRFVN